ncbi:lactoylglutathione lyase and related lyases [Halarchaeum acidiphilum MH1-52-1]|uniref:Lactoylglutathione lyase and related lyases n=1 Tax=Halarchaeum acidiphilum MH1-52-1 TaxID=1261545 RepID=U2YW35_9EURY|nr:VOC family protein [Halarchaeum acidiphilum]GAD53240.1 lactoylglutathione lyase and related lyases [Halarchaeum acidiphilum MH1-52-1]
MDDVPDVDIDVPAIDQLGLVVEDLDAGIERYGSLFGIGPWEVYRFAPPELTERTYRGEPADFSWDLAFADAGDVQIELIQPLEGENLYTEHLEEHGEGLHHVACFSFDDPADAVDAFVDAGYPVVQHGRLGGSEFWYMDAAADANGLLFETASNLEEKPEPDRVVEP